MTWISIPVRKLTLNHKIRCVKCGGLLDQQDLIDTIESGRPPYHYPHCKDVEEEWLNGIGMWPSGWYGHCWIDQLGEFHIEADV